ncbi:MAG: hypothetical protein A3B91_02110 [Candidatus Yanofskybacteria bacterium RIFCSPHIGHO2_02_FULL_41_29]|uniref:CPBP family intramembrane metalloprotease n=1 Tax=Candidatus Yanofskybacteria bacterium RIFCSPHIGHO2_01_FULL_41_53 TaxID=1802663 RepID=A0A1F8EG32_9BACT|nr:MAG: hypothetical protein A2650_05015 [Candidatus Yanofskybacteria bacterium RIFCSPHIGHO2_01_FULL_41_53]OGN12320.1 MAG: hypothetical protein A3B91_02110 [Candidatus Yanofskybacteria bacterium RIFCSPHIGHO2_02_FULL_41_29]OGN17721.1 MAG: hypothetical protein A3F48_00585 [Candidatus Yanofskybacteria bacterium RIFCSPHIGHO2_12_FULL_41_9]OGN22027.1 MAG: hypothetical protein A2916_04355 [Candidatus Yanofskybacteria bacterium RIFCSPLOWO2_01_FULL_41_67]OGN28917.1 MAG: hypothetical protein A3H54_02115 
MDPPNNQQAWKLILWVWLVNMVTTPVIFYLSFRLLSGKPQDLQTYSSFLWGFLVPWNQFGFFFTNFAIDPALYEEFLFRFPIIIAISVLSWLGYSLKNSNLSRILTVGIAIGLNVWWASGHIPILAGFEQNGTHIVKYYYFLFPPVFFSGLTWIWLTLKIQPAWPWPSIVAHILANTSIYVALKVAELIGVKIF